MSEQENRLAKQVARVMLFGQAARYIGGHEALASALGIQVRSLRAKFSADRGVSDADLRAAVTAMDARVAEIREKAAKIRELIA